MNDTHQYPQGVEYRTPRPRGTWAGALLGSLFGLAATGSAGGAIAGGLIGEALTNQPPPPLNIAVRQYFSERGLQVAGFYRPSPNVAQVAFGYKGRGWLVESRAPKNVNWTVEDLEDWLYGDLTEFQLPAKLHKIQSSVRR